MGSRRISLAAWQEREVAQAPWPFVRGLIHADGCRTVYRITRRTGGTVRQYSYPRYFFPNRSADVVALLTGTLDALGVEWTCSERPGRTDVSVARRASVALMDAHVGPKW